MLLLFPALMVSFLWGAEVVIHKHLLKHMSPHFMLFVHASLYAICISVFAFWYWDKIKRDMTFNKIKTNGIWIFVATVLCSFLAQMIYFHTLAEHHSAVVSALIYTSPVFVLLLATCFLQEKISTMAVAGMVLIVSGVVILALNEKGNVDEYVDVFK